MYVDIVRKIEVWFRLTIEKVIIDLVGESSIINLEKHYNRKGAKKFILDEKKVKKVLQNSHFYTDFGYYFYIWREGWNYTYNSPRKYHFRKVLDRVPKFQKFIPYCAYCTYIYTYPRRFQLVGWELDWVNNFNLMLS